MEDNIWRIKDEDNGLDNNFGGKLRLNMKVLSVGLEYAVNRTL